MLVAMAEMERVVRKVMEVAMVTIKRVEGRPTFPRTQPKRKYMTTPKMVRMLGVKTPLKVPNA